jgi:VIT1/CCC1 family predicted Fe2+/Mn2+ transporter
MIDPSGTGLHCTHETRGERERFVRNLLAEEDSAVLYEALATLERDLRQADVYRRLAASERDHAEYWRARLAAAGHPVPKHALSLRTRVLIHLARWFGSGFVIPSIAVRERGDHKDYSGQSDASEAGLAIDEHGHAETLRAMTARTVDTNLRAAVLGANDGLASNFCLLMGMVGGRAATSTIVLAGTAGLVAGAVSMALGEWLSVTNARELTESLADPASAEPDHGEAWSAARFSFSLFAIGAAVPMLPFVLFGSGLAVAGSIGSSITALAVLGLATSLFNGRSARFSAARQVVIGAAAALVTYGVGRFVAVVAG